VRSPPPVPPLRPDVRPKQIQTAQGPRLVVDDPAQRVRVPIDELTLEVMECLAEGPMEQDDLAAELGAPRLELQRRVRLLARQLLLETPRAQAMLELARAHVDDAPTGPVPADVPLTFSAGLRHGCVACGACCHGTDVGPLTDDDVARVAAIDWAPHLPPDVRREDWIVEVPQSVIKPGASDAPVRLMGHRHGRCVFLGADKLCVIHKVHGASTKPTICRQFPYTFTRTPRGVDVSFSMECRAWWTAKQAGRPPEEDEAQIRALLAERAPVLVLPVPVPVMDGLAFDLPGWESVRGASLDGVERAADLPALLRAIVEPSRRALERVMGGFAASEVFAERVAWGIPEADAVDQSARFFEAVARLRGALAEGLSAIGQGMKDRGRPEEADRVQRLGWGTSALLEGRRADDALRFPHEHEIWQDMCRAAFQAHEPVRRGGLVHGVATLALRLLSGHLLSGLLASVALRGRTSEQDATDAMVLVTKLWRGTAFERLLTAVRHDLADVFFWNAAVLAEGAAPGPIPPWAA